MNTVDLNLSPNDSYGIFINNFTKIYDQAFPVKKKTKDLGSSWITKGIKNLQRKWTVVTDERLRLYKRFFQTKSRRSLETYKNLFEKIKKCLLTSWKVWKKYRSSHPEVFCKKGVPKNIR